MDITEKLFEAIWIGLEDAEIESLDTDDANVLPHNDHADMIIPCDLATAERALIEACITEEAERLGIGDLALHWTWTRIALENGDGYAARVRATF